MPGRPETAGAGPRFAVLLFLGALLVPVLVVVPYRHHPPGALDVKELAFQAFALATVVAVLLGGVSGDFPRSRLVLVAGSLIAGLWLTPFLSETHWIGAARETTLVAFLVAGALLARRRPGLARTTARALTVVAGLSASWYLLQLLLWWADLPYPGPFFDLTTDSPAAGFLNRNQVATLFLMGWLASLLFLKTPGPWRWPARATSVLLLVALVATRTEGAWLGAGAGVLLLLAHLPPAGGRRALGRGAAAVLVGLLLLSLASVLLVAAGGPTVARGLPRSPTLVERAALWRIAWNTSWSLPFGVGPGEFHRALYRDQADVITDPAYAGVEFLSIHAHDDLLEEAATIGWPLAGILYGLLLACLVRGLRCRDDVGSGPAASTVLAAAVLGALVHGLVHYPLQLPGIRGLLLGIAGLLFGCGGRGLEAPTRKSTFGALAVGLLCLPGLLLSLQAALAASALDRGLRLGAEGRLVEAQAALERAVEIRPRWAVGWANLGTAQTLQGKLGPASRSFLRAVAHSDAMDPEILANAASVEARRGRRGQSLEWYDRALQIHPLHVPSLVGKARLLEERGDRARARSLYRRALDLDPEHPAARRGLQRLSPREGGPQAGPAPE